MYFLSFRKLFGVKLLFPVPLAKVHLQFDDFPRAFLISIAIIIACLPSWLFL